MKSSRILTPPLRTCLAAALLAAGAFPLTAQDEGVAIRMENGVPVVATDGYGSLEVAASPAGPWRPLREAAPGAQAETEVPLDLQTRFVRLRRPDGRLTEVESIIPDLPENPPKFEKVTLTRYNGRTARVEAVAPRVNDRTGPLLLPYVYGDVLTLLRDDGLDGDGTANDGVYTGEVPIPLEALEAAREFAASQPDNAVYMPFENRHRSPARGIPLRESARQLEALIEGGPVTLPIPLGVSPSAGVSIGQVPGLITPGGGVTPCNQLPTWPKTLLITDLTVVEDPTRTFDPATGTGTPMGAWTFGKLMSDMANTPVSGISASDFARRWLRSWEVNQTINNDPVPERAAGMAATVLQAWQAASGGADQPLDMARAPFRLLAVVNRIDLRGNISYGGGLAENTCDPPCRSGEARFVFGFADRRLDGENGYPGEDGDVADDPRVPVRGREFLVILEYCIPKHTCGELHRFAREWAALQCIPFGPEYNKALQAITDQFAAAGASPGRPNDSAISQVRTNENLLDPLWELREFRIFRNDSDAGHLRPVTVKQTPRESVDATPLLADYIQTTFPSPPNHTVPLEWGIAPGGPLQPFLGGRAIMRPISLTSGSSAWATTGSAVPNMIRHDFALNTCSGCHSTETDSPFVHVGSRIPGQPAFLSGFLKGDGAGGPFSVNIPGAPAATVEFFDLQRREQDLIHFILTPCGLAMFDRPLEDGAVH